MLADIDDRPAFKDAFGDLDRLDGNLDRCFDSVAMARFVSDLDPEARVAVGEARDQVLEVRMLARAGNTEDAMRRLKTIRSETEPLGYGPLGIELDMAESEVLLARGKASDAAKKLEMAFSQSLAMEDIFSRRNAVVALVRIRADTLKDEVGAINIGELAKDLVSDDPNAQGVVLKYPLIFR